MAMLMRCNASPAIASGFRSEIVPDDSSDERLRPALSDIAAEICRVMSRAPRRAVFDLSWGPERSWHSDGSRWLPFHGELLAERGAIATPRTPRAATRQDGTSWSLPAQGCD